MLDVNPKQVRRRSASGPVRRRRARAHGSREPSSSPRLSLQPQEGRDSTIASPRLAETFRSSTCRGWQRHAVVSPLPAANPERRNGTDNRDQLPRRQLGLPEPPFHLPKRPGRGLRFTRRVDLMPPAMNNGRPSETCRRGRRGALRSSSRSTSDHRVTGGRLTPIRPAGS